MSSLSTQTVGQLVVDQPARSRVFEQLGIDYCCGGKLPLIEACRKRGLETDAVLRLLAEVDEAAAPGPGSAPGSGETDPARMSLAELANHIEQRHHEYLRTELPRLDQLTAKVASVHGGRDPRLVRVRELFLSIRDELLSHIDKEERVLFPAIRALESGSSPAGIPGGSLENPVRQLVLEHEHSGEALADMREQTDNFTPAENACNTHRAMLDALIAFERDLHQHVHKENNILFPRALALATPGNLG